MSETATEQTAETTEQAAETTADVDWKAQARKHEAAAKELRAKLKAAEPQLTELATLKAASQTEAERQAAALTEATTRAEKAERDAMKASVALAKGLPPELAARLQGDDHAALEADADELLKFANPTNQTRAPRPDYSQASTANGGAASTPADQFAALMKQQLGS